MSRTIAREGVDESAAMARYLQVHDVLLTVIDQNSGGVDAASDVGTRWQPEPACKSDLANTLRDNHDKQFMDQPPCQKSRPLNRVLRGPRL